MNRKELDSKIRQLASCGMYAWQIANELGITECRVMKALKNY